jgi:hypothetical protein
MPRADGKLAPVSEKVTASFGIRPGFRSRRIARDLKTTQVLAVGHRCQGRRCLLGTLQQQQQHRPVPATPTSSFSVNGVGHV